MSFGVAVGVFHIYIYIYMCVCVCVFTCAFIRALIFLSHVINDIFTISTF